MRELKVEDHERLERALEERYNSDSWSLKLLLQELLAAHKIKLKRRRPLEALEEELGVV